MSIAKQIPEPNAVCENCTKEIYRFESKKKASKRNFCTLSCAHNVKWSYYGIIREYAGKKTKREVAEMIGVPLGTVDFWCRSWQREPEEELPARYKFTYLKQDEPEDASVNRKGLAIKTKDIPPPVATTTNRNTFGADKAIREPRDRSKETAVVFVNGKQIWFDPALKKAEDLTKKYEDRDRQKYIETYGRNPPDYEGSRQAYIH